MCGVFKEPSKELAEPLGSTLGSVKPGLKNTALEWELYQLKFALNLTDYKLIPTKEIIDFPLFRRSFEKKSIISNKSDYLTFIRFI